MKQSVLIRRVSNLLSKASERCTAETPNRANLRLSQIHELLGKELKLEAGGTTRKTAGPGDIDR